MALVKCRECGKEVSEQVGKKSLRANRREIFKIGLVFVAVDILLWILLFVSAMIVGGDMSMFIVLLIANPLAIVWIMGGVGGEQTLIESTIETSWLVLSGILFYFLVGVIIGVLSQRTQKAGTCPHCGCKYPSRGILDHPLCVGWRSYVLVTVLVLIIMLFLRCR